MAQGPEVDAGRALVLDANIMLRGVLGTRVRALIERYANDVSLLTPQSCVDEVREYLPSLCAKRGWILTAAAETLDALLTGIQVVENASLADVEDDARRRIAARDPDDWPGIALAIAINAPVWTEDTDFFGAGAFPYGRTAYGQPWRAAPSLISRKPFCRVSRLSESNAMTSPFELIALAAVTVT